MKELTSDEAYRALKEVSKARGHSKRKHFVPGLKPYLLAAYDPFKRYGIKISRLPLIPGYAQFEDMTWHMLDLLASGELSGNEAKDTVDTVVRSMTEESAELLIQILNKDLRIGMGAKSINKVFPGLIPTHDVMLAKVYSESKARFPCWGTPKLDGVRAIFRKGHFYSRNGHMYKGLDVLEAELYDVGDQILDCELTVPGRTFQEASGSIRSFARTPMAIATILDIPTIKASFDIRLSEAFILSTSCPHVKYLTKVKLHSHAEVIAYFNDCRLHGYEGAVIRSLDYKYRGTRSYDWMKVKDVLSVDLIVRDIFEGMGKYRGSLGGAIVSYKGQEVRVGTGFSDAERKYFWSNRDDIVGHVIEIEYMELTDGGSLRHPRFICFRPDKEA